MPIKSPKKVGTPTQTYRTAVQLYSPLPNSEIRPEMIHIHTESIYFSHTQVLKIGDGTHWF